MGKPRLRRILTAVLSVALAFFTIMLVMDSMQSAREEAALKKLAEKAAQAEPNIPPSGPLPAQPPDDEEPQPPAMLEQYRELYEQNSDMIGWIRIEGTGIDFPVMYTKDDFYLSHGFDKKSAKNGIPYVDKRCSVEPFGTNTIIYGHNMKDGRLFAELLRYKEEAYYREHPLIRFDTLYETREYEIISAFESQVYRKSDTVFKHYNFLNAESEADFDEYIGNIRSLSLYDTGAAAQYGDELITLMTCSYHTENGRFVVVARRTGEAN